MASAVALGEQKRLEGREGSQFSLVGACLSSCASVVAGAQWCWASVAINADDEQERRVQDNGWCPPVSVTFSWRSSAACVPVAFSTFASLILALTSLPFGLLAAAQVVTWPLILNEQEAATPSTRSSRSCCLNSLNLRARHSAAFCACCAEWRRIAPSNKALVTIQICELFN